MIPDPARLLMECDRCEARVNAEYFTGYEAYEAEEGISYRYYFCRCPACNEPMVAISGNYGETDNARHWDTPSRYLPRPDAALARFPSAIEAAFGEARRCFRAKAFTAATVMCRKTLEGICAAHGITEANLATSLRKMRDTGVIDSRLFEWADALRISGNEAAHGVQVSFTRDDASDVLEFTKALLEYVFTFRDKFDQFQQRRGKMAGLGALSGRGHR